jgi:hypothetical protein
MKVVDGFEFERRGPTRKYDWDSLLDGRVWQLDRGRDFDCLPEVFRRQAYNRATQEGKHVRVYIDGERIHLQAHNGGKAA